MIQWYLQYDEHDDLAVNDTMHSATIAYTGMEAGEQRPNFYLLRATLVFVARLAVLLACSASSLRFFADALAGTRDVFALGVFLGVYS